MPRTTMPLSDPTIRKTKPADTPVKLADGGGLYLRLKPNGARWWRWDYRRPITGKRNTLSLGTYPDTGLAAARDKRDEARKLLAAGIDPGEHRAAEKAAGQDRAANSFEVVAREWLSKRDWKRDWVEGYAGKVTAWLGNDVFPWIGSKPVAELGAPNFLKVGRRIKDRGAIESTHRILRNCAQIMRYAVATGRADRNPVDDLSRAHSLLLPSTTMRQSPTPKRLADC